jgi:hypothetical protein
MIAVNADIPLTVPESGRTGLDELSTINQGHWTATRSRGTDRNRPTPYGTEADYFRVSPTR